MPINVQPSEPTARLRRCMAARAIAEGQDSDDESAARTLYRPNRLERSSLMSRIRQSSVREPIVAKGWA